MRVVRKTMPHTYTLIICCSVIARSFAAIVSLDGPFINPVRERRAVSCNLPLVFNCSSGECIDGIKECDGFADCLDGSDETKHCRSFKCSGRFFQCAYGACVTENAQCNNSTECADNSDEKYCGVRCSGDEFTCKIGQCINGFTLCDGHEDCEDGSDETLEECKSIECSDLNFKCNYGPCLESSVKCNGTIECADGSDEDAKLCENLISKPVIQNITERPSINDCVLPPHPAHGYYKILDEIDNPIPGLLVPQYKSLQFYCTINYKLQGTHIVACKKGVWNDNEPLPTCIRTCKQLTSSSLDISCYLNKSPVRCNERVPEGTKATFECKDGYEIFHSPYKTISCQDGSWNDDLIKCQPVCGTQSKGVTLIIDGQKANVGQYPWHVGIYLKSQTDYIYNCGGSIISPNMILTAAHCFPNLNLIHLYRIAAGKHFSKWNDERDKYVEYSNIFKILPARRYVGIQNGFAADIAIVVLETPLNMSTVIQPVCLDLNSVDELFSSNPGYVPGWGLTSESGSISEELRFLNFPVIPYKQCLETVPNDFQTFVTLDKFCAGYTNGSSVCEGDSGGGYVTVKSINNKNRFYIRGIVSSAPQKEDSCDSRQYATFTNIFEHRMWIDEKRAEYSIRN